MSYTTSRTLQQDWAPGPCRGILLECVPGWVSSPPWLTNLCPYWSFMGIISSPNFYTLSQGLLLRVPELR